MGDRVRVSWRDEKNGYKQGEVVSWIYSDRASVFAVIKQDRRFVIVDMDKLAAEDSY